MSALPPAVEAALTRWGLAVDRDGSAAIASSHNFTLVCRRGRERLFLKSGEQVDAEARLLRALRASGRVPRVVHASRGVLALEWLEGTPYYYRRASAGPLEEIGAALKWVHAQPPVERASGADFIAQLLWTPPALYAQLGEATLALLADVQGDAAGERALHRLYAENAAGVALVHGDFRHANVMVRRAQVRIIDWERCGTGDPARDVGTWLAEDVAEYLAGAMKLSQLNRRSAAFSRGYGGLTPRAAAWAGEALLQRAFTTAWHHARYERLERHLVASGLELVKHPRKWAARFFA